MATIHEQLLGNDLQLLCWETFIEDNEDKVKALQEKYEFTYEIIEK